MSLQLHSVLTTCPIAIVYVSERICFNLEQLPSVLKSLSFLYFNQVLVLIWQFIIYLFNTPIMDFCAWMHWDGEFHSSKNWLFFPPLSPSASVSLTFRQTWKAKEQRELRITKITALQAWRIKNGTLSWDKIKHENSQKEGITGQVPEMKQILYINWTNSMLPTAKILSHSTIGKLAINKYFHNHFGLSKIF